MIKSDRLKDSSQNISPPWGQSGHAMLPPLVALVIVLAHLPLLIQLGRSMWAREHYQFFPIVLLGAVYLAWNRRDLFAFRNRPHRVWAILFWCAAGLLFSGGVLLGSPWLAGASLLVGLWAGVYALGGLLWLKHTSPTLLFLALALPLPSQYDFKLINRLQRDVAQWAAQTLDLFGYRHMLDGINLTFVERAFTVEEACSGIHSLFAALCCTVFYLAYSRRGFFRYLYLIPIAVFWVIVANILRILLVTLLSMKLGLPVDTGIGHELMGVFVFVFAMGLVFSTDRLILYILPLRLAEGTPQARVPDELPSRHALAGPPVLSREACWFAWILLIGFSTLGGLSFARDTAQALQRNVAFEESDFRRVPPSALPENWNGWTMLGHQSETRELSNPFGAYSQQWVFQRSGLRAIVSLDSPFDDWHDLEVCYSNLGWNVIAQTDLVGHQTAEPADFRTELVMTKPAEGYQYLLFSAFDARHSRVTAPPFYRSPTGRRFLRELRSLASMFGADRRSHPLPVYQIQLLIPSRVPLTPPQIQQCREFFDHVRSRIGQTESTPEDA